MNNADLIYLLVLKWLLFESNELIFLLNLLYFVSRFYVKHELTIRYLYFNN